MADEAKHSGRRPSKPLAKPVRLYPIVEDIAEDTPVIIDPEGPRQPELRKLLSIISIFIVFMICVYLLGLPLSSLFSSKLYLSLAAGNTIKSLNREIMAFASGNSVIKRSVTLLQEPNEHILQINTGFGLINQPFDFKLQNDFHRNQLMMEISRDSSGSASFYLSDDTMGLRINKEVYAVNPKAASEDLNALLTANGSDIRMPLELDISYSACKRLIMGGSLSAAAPAYDRLYNRYREIVQSLFEMAKYNKSSNEKISLGGKSVRCKTIRMQISSQDMRKWMIELADAIHEDEDLKTLFGKLQLDWEMTVRRRSFFHNGNIVIDFLCYKNRIVSVRYSHVESQVFFEVSTLGEKYRLDNISFISYGVYKSMFQAAGSHISPGEFRTNLYVSGLGNIDDLNKLQIVWEPSKESDNVTLGKLGMIIKRFTFSENENGVFISIPGIHDNSIPTAYTLTKMNKRPEWPDYAGSFAEIDLGWFREFLEN